jgi:uncharacterized membrane protein
VAAVDFDVNFAAAVAFRWMHILAAITAVGGAIFMRLALLPAAATLPEAERKKLEEAVRSRWVKWIMAAILFLLVSGFYNFITMTMRYKLPSLYQGLFGVKFLLALAIFFLASVLSGRSEMGQRFRRNARTWLTLNVALAVALVCISGVMKTMDHGPAKADNPEKPVQPAHAAGFDTGRAT